MSNYKENKRIWLVQEVDVLGDGDGDDWYDKSIYLTHEAAMEKLEELRKQKPNLRFRAAEFIRDEKYKSD